MKRVLVLLAFTASVFAEEPAATLDDFSKELSTYLDEAAKMGNKADLDLDHWDKLELKWLTWEMRAVVRAQPSPPEGFSRLIQLSKLARSSMGVQMASWGIPDGEPYPARMEYENLQTIWGKVYDGARVREVEPDGLRIIHAAGVAKIPFDDLPEVIRIEHSYDPDKAAAFRLKNRTLRATLPEKSAGAEPETAEERDADCLDIARKEWPGDYAMQKYTYERQVKAKRAMERAGDAECKRFAVAEWPNDYAMQEYTYRRQMEAKKALSK